MSLILIILGFGFVIFWHELGHFLAARWAGVRVEHFAVGMGQALVSWRKGIGLRCIRWTRDRGLVWGSTQKEFDERVDAELERRRNVDGPFKDMFEATLAQRHEIASELGIGETEYRLSWIPIGGYVKMVGQDDLRPQKEVGSDDPKSYAAKSVGKRMVIISAGVVMNVILAGILFPILFMYGFTAPTPMIGYVAPNSPAQQAGIQVGDRFETIDGHRIHDFTKVPFNVALLPKDRPTKIQLLRDGQLIEKTVQQVWNPEVGSLQIGVGGFDLLTRADTPEAREFEKVIPTDPTKHVEIGESIIAANGESLGLLDYPKLWTIVQKSGGEPVTLTLQRADGSTRELTSTPEYQPWFVDEMNFIGLQPRTIIANQWKPAEGLMLDMKPGDVVASIKRADAAAPIPFPALEKFIEVVGKAGSDGVTIKLALVRNGATHELPDLTAKELLAAGAAFDFDDSPVVGSVVNVSASALAGIPEGAALKSIDGQQIKSWRALHAMLLAHDSRASIIIAADTADGAKEFQVDLTNDALASVRKNVFTLPAIDRRLDTQEFERRTTNPVEAFKWGVGETRDTILKTYLTLRRLTVDRTVSPFNLMGPIGMIDTGRLLAQRGPDWLIWFLAIVSANLAVVNFLPLPIVDGGHFCFLLMEKITGKPASPKLMAATTYAGLTLMLGFFLFVTYNDVARMFMR